MILSIQDRRDWRADRKPKWEICVWDNQRGQHKPLGRVWDVGQARELISACKIQVRRLKLLAGAVADCAGPRFYRPASGRKAAHWQTAPLARGQQAIRAEYNRDAAIYEKAIAECRKLLGPAPTWPKLPRAGKAFVIPASKAKLFPARYTRRMFFDVSRYQCRAA